MLKALTDQTTIHHYFSTNSRTTPFLLITYRYNVSVECYFTALRTLTLYTIPTSAYMQILKIMSGTLDT